MLAEYWYDSARCAIKLIATKNMRAKPKKRWVCSARDTPRFLNQQIARAVKKIRWTFCVQLWAMVYWEAREMCGRRD